MTVPEERLVALEIRAAEQERTIEELSGQIAEQWTAIERLERMLAARGERLHTLEDIRDIPVTKPPHW